MGNKIFWVESHQMKDWINWMVHFLLSELHALWNIRVEASIYSVGRPAL
jgi:hypothetical protein